VVFLPSPSPARTAAKSFEESTMTDTVWLSAVTLMVLGYLFYALLVPEKF
jgi:K+-transporting ATPase KdpF subunit